jgi:hypothetical protein
MTEDLASLPADWGAGVSPRGLAVTQARRCRLVGCPLILSRDAEGMSR